MKIDAEALRKEFERLDASTSEEAKNIHWAWFMAGVYKLRNQIEQQQNIQETQHDKV